MSVCPEAKSACIRRMQARLELWDQDLDQIVQKKLRDGVSLNAVCRDEMVSNLPCLA